LARIFHVKINMKTGLAMSNETIPMVELMFRNKDVLEKHFLSGPPYGGLAIITTKAVDVDETVELRVWLMSENVCEDLRGVVIWRRRHLDHSYQVGVAFFGSESEKRERLLNGIRPTPETRLERREQRHPIAVRVTYRTPMDFVVDYTRNLSMGGMFLKTKNAPPVGATVLFKLFAQGLDEVIELMGKVAWKREGEGVGVRFVDDNPSVRSRLEQVVRNIPIEPGSLMGPPLVQ
jgi:type IV pilus assembly protein PilZ